MKNKKLKKLDLKTDDLMLMEFRQEYWDLWESFINKLGYGAKIAGEDEL